MVGRRSSLACFIRSALMPSENVEAAAWTDMISLNRRRSLFLLGLITAVSVQRYRAAAERRLGWCGPAVKFDRSSLPKWCSTVICIAVFQRAQIHTRRTQQRTRLSPPRRLTCVWCPANLAQSPPVSKNPHMHGSAQGMDRTAQEKLALCSNFLVFCFLLFFAEPVLPPRKRHRFSANQHPPPHQRDQEERRRVRIFSVVWFQLHNLARVLWDGCGNLRVLFVRAIGKTSSTRLGREPLSLFCGLEIQKSYNQAHCSDGSTPFSCAAQSPGSCVLNGVEWPPNQTIRPFFSYHLRPRRDVQCSSFAALFVSVPLRRPLAFVTWSCIKPLLCCVSPRLPRCRTPTSLARLPGS